MSVGRSNGAYTCSVTAEIADGYNTTLLVRQLSGGDVKQLALLVVQILAVKTDCQRLALRLVTDPQQ